MKPILGLSTYRWNNNIKSILLLMAFPCLLLALVAAFFFIIGWMETLPQGTVNPDLAASFNLLVSTVSPTPASFALVATKSFSPYVFGITGLWILIGSFFNEGLIRMATRAKPVTRKEAPDLYNLVENLCISRGMAIPKIFLIDTPAMNAYASGLTENSFSITVTRGLAETLNRDELEAVLAHELSHIINRDVRLLLVTVLFGGMLSFFAEMLWRSMRYGTTSNGETRSRNRGFVMIVAALVLSLGYLIALLFRFALSRRREYLADAGSVELTKNPIALITALKKISCNAALPHIPSGVQAMLIENPVSIISLFATHPTIQDRIAVLRQFAGMPEEGESVIPKVGG